MSLPRRIGVAAAVGLFVLAAAVVVVFALGKPTTTRVSPETATPATVPGGATSITDTATASASDASDPLAIEIPGCVCHSDDPQLVAEHATRRMSECFECHQGGMPEMGQ
jgi:hypothetical protein